MLRGGSFRRSTVVVSFFPRHLTHTEDCDDAWSRECMGAVDGQRL
jgi:hypothetical protein